MRLLGYFHGTDLAAALIEDGRVVASSNVLGEAIVCARRDAIRWFAAIGLDALAIGAFIVEKPRAPLAVRPDDVLR